MNSIVIRLFVLACTFGGALLGMLLRAVLPERHLSGDSKETVRLGMGMVATMAALVLGLLVASAKNFYDTQSSDLTQLSANVVLLDRVLAHYGPETKEARDLLRGAVARSLNLIWHQNLNNLPKRNPQRPAAKLSMIKFRRYPQRTMFNAHSRPRRPAWLLILENCAG